MKKRDRIILNKILDNQKILADTMRELHISSAQDLGSIHYVMRRGLVQVVGDIYELTVPLSEDLVQQLPMRVDTVKQFRHTASHSYGQISDGFAYTCIKHCIDKQFVQAIRKLLEEAEEVQGQEEREM